MNVFPDYSIYDITHEGVTVSFHIIIVDVPVYCGSRSNINLEECIWKRVCICCQNVRYILRSSQHTYSLLPKSS